MGWKKHNRAFELICGNNVANKLHGFSLLSVPADCDRVASLSSRFYDLLIWYYRFYELNCPSANRFVNHNSYLAKGQGNSMTYIVFPLRQLLLSSTWLSCTSDSMVRWALGKTRNTYLLLTLAKLFLLLLFLFFIALSSQAVCAGLGDPTGIFYQWRPLFYSVFFLLHLSLLPRAIMGPFNGSLMPLLYF